jgi:hypothetical protein
VFPVVFTDCTHPVVNDAYLDGVSGARRSGVHLTGTGGVASMGLVQSSVFNHSCLLVEVDDVKLVDSWVWGMTCDYAVAVRDGSASFVANNVDIVPPFTSTATGIAGIVIGDDGSAPLNSETPGRLPRREPDALHHGRHQDRPRRGRRAHQEHPRQPDGGRVDPR